MSSPHDPSPSELAGLNPQDLLRAGLEPVDPAPADPDVTVQLSPSQIASTHTQGRQPDLPLPEELTALLPGQAYQVEGFLGQGGMGAVYKGTQIRLKRPVAIKIMRRDLGRDYDFEARFEREAQAMAKLSHPNIVSVIDFGEAGPDYLYIVMELVDGADLMDVIRGGQMTQEMAITLLPQICDALQFAHEHGIIHRDIKPSNIMLTRDGRIKMADFGLAKRLDTESTMHTKTGTGMGTPDYAAPEQFDPNGHIDHRADIYALGVMIYQMITGTLPRGAWKSPSERAPVAQQWDGIVSRAMQSDPADRYQHASEVKTDVSSISLVKGGKPIRQPEVAPRGTHAVPSAAKKSRESLLVGLAVSTVLLVIGLLWISNKSAPETSSLHQEPREKSWQPLVSEKEWTRQVPGRRAFEEGILHFTNPASNSSYPLTQSGEPLADGAIRAQLEIREGSAGPSLCARRQKENIYQLLLRPDAKTFVLARSSIFETAKEGTLLGKHVLHKPLAPGDTVLMELRVQGDRLTALINGAMVIESRDSGLMGPGDWGIRATDGWFKSAELQKFEVDDLGGNAEQPAMSSRFPPGQWVKIFSTMDDLPVKQRSYLQMHQGWLDGGTTGSCPVINVPGILGKNQAIRARMKMAVLMGENTFGSKLAVRSQATPNDDGAEYRLIFQTVKLQQQVAISYFNKSAQIAKPLTPFRPVFFETGQEIEIEMGIVGTRLIGRLNGVLFPIIEDQRIASGGLAVQAKQYLRDIEVINLDNLSEAEALKILGVDEKGNDLRNTTGAASAATKDAPFTNSLGMKFVPVPIGSGPTRGRQVLFSAWSTRVRDYRAYAESQAAAGKKVDDSWLRQKKDGVPLINEPDYPVVGVSWDDAQAFCQWLTDIETTSGRLSKGGRYRLPSDEEWSWAAGLPEETGRNPLEKGTLNSVDFPWGREWPPVNAAGNYADETFHALFPEGTDPPVNKWLMGYTDGYAMTSPVGSFPPNAFGLYDMGGNATQWCEDWLDESRKERVQRGASWGVSIRGWLRSTERGRSPPGLRNHLSGFRVVLEMPAFPKMDGDMGRAPAPGTPSASTAMKDAPFTNTRDMKPVRLPITTGKDVGSGWREISLAGSEITVPVTAANGLVQVRYHRTTSSALDMITLDPQRIELRLWRHDIKLHQWSGASTLPDPPGESWTDPLPAGAEGMLQLAWIGNEAHAWWNGRKIGSRPLDRSAGAPRQIMIRTDTKQQFTWFKDLATLSLDGLESDAALALASSVSRGPAPSALPSPAAEPWEDMLHDPSNLELLGVERTADGLRFPANGSAQVPGNFKNACIRFRFTFDSRNRPHLSARSSAPGSYTLQATDEKTIRLGFWDNAVMASTTLRTFPLPQPIREGQECTLELRAVGSSLTVRLDDKLLGTVEDTRSTAGRFGVNVTLAQQPGMPPAIVRSLEFFDLDKAVSSSSYSTATKDAPFINSLSMKFVPVPGTDVLMCAHETRRKDYEAFASSTPGVDVIWKTPIYDQKPLLQADDHPVVSVCWTDARAFADWLSRKEGKRYRLPTEKEWNLAVVTGLQNPGSASPEEVTKMLENQYPWGTEKLSDADRLGNYKGAQDGYEGTSPVMSFPPNNLGIHDLGGNVWEWCQEFFEPGKDWKVIRGGSFLNFGPPRKSGWRVGAEHNFRRMPRDDYQRRMIGFRLVMEKDPVSPGSASASTAPAPDRNRAAALMILGKGGTAMIAEGVKQQEVKNAAELPAGAFEVVGLKLELSGGKVVPLSSEEMQTLTGLPRLAVLTLKNTMLHDADLAVLRTLPSLTLVNLADNPSLTDAGMEHLGALEQLTLLHLQACRSISSSGVLRLAGLKNLVELNLGRLTTLDEKALPAILGLRKLDLLNLDGCERVTPAFIEALAELPELSSLQLSPGQMKAPIALGRLKTLKQLGIYGTSGDNLLPEPAGRSLAGAQSLKTLRLTRLSLTDTQVAEVSRLLSVTHLRLQQVQLPAVSLAPLKDSQILWVQTEGDDNRFDDAALRSLIPVKSLLEVRLCSKSPVTLPAIAEFQKARPNVKVVR